MHPSCLQVLIMMALCYSVISLIESDREGRCKYTKDSQKLRLQPVFLTVISWGWGPGVVRFENAACTAVNSLTGTCYTRRQCDTVGGFRAGRCAQNIAVCCVSK